MEEEGGLEGAGGAVVVEEDGEEMEVRSGVELDWLAAGSFSGSDVCCC